MKAVKFLTVVCAVVFLNGLLTTDSFAQKTEVIEPIESKPVVIQTSVGNDSDISDNRQTNEKYRIGFQDTLEVLVVKHPELSLVVNVSPDGTIRLPRIELPITAVCKTELELKNDIESLYKKSHLRNPFVNVRTIEQRSQPFSVIGAVEKPGSFYLSRKIQLLGLLAYAGGPKVEKAGANIQVARVGDVSGCQENTETTDDEMVFFTYKIKDVQEGKVNPWMQPGDIVSVGEVEQAFVVGNVKEPSKVPLREQVTMTQAIAFAGGLAPEAKTSKVRIQRQQSGSAQKTEMIYDLKDIASKKIPDPILQPNDIVEVPKDGVKSIRNGLIKVFTGGLPTLIRGY